MPWVRIDDHIDQNPKIAAIDDHALALFVCGLAYCNRNLTDGFIPNMVGLGQLRYCDGNTSEAIRQLEGAGLWEKTETGWNVHDYPDYQPSKAQVLAERDVKAEAGRIGGQRSAEVRAARYGTAQPKQTPKHVLRESPKQTPKQNSNPDPVSHSFPPCSPPPPGGEPARSVREMLMDGADSQEVEAVVCQMEAVATRPFIGKSKRQYYAIAANALEANYSADLIVSCFRTWFTGRKNPGNLNPQWFEEALPGLAAAASNGDLTAAGSTVPPREYSHAPEGWNLRTAAVSP